MPQFVGRRMPTTIHVWPTLRPRFPMLCASPLYRPAGNEARQEGLGWQGTPYPMSNRGTMRCGHPCLRYILHFLVFVDSDEGNWHLQPLGWVILH
jgi:hypothetical protein